MLKESLIKYQLFWRNPIVRIKALLYKHAYCMVKSNNVESGYWVSPHRAGFQAHIFGVMILVKAVSIHCESCLESVRLKARRINETYSELP